MWVELLGWLSLIMKPRPCRYDRCAIVEHAPRHGRHLGQGALSDCPDRATRLAGTQDAPRHSRPAPAGDLDVSEIFTAMLTICCGRLIALRYCAIRRNAAAGWQPQKRWYPGGILDRLHLWRGPALFLCRAGSGHGRVVPK